MWADHRNMVDDPLNFMLGVTLSSNTPVSKYVKDLLDNEINDTSEAMNNIIQNVSNSSSSKCIYYKSINPNMQVHNIYNMKYNINELERISWTKLRLSAHSLAIETGRWNRGGRGHLPVEQRLCQCGQVQTEHHMMEDCPRSQYIRDLYGFNSMEYLMLESNDFSNIFQVVHRILNLYK